MKKTNLLVIAVLVALCHHAGGQGFVNLDFEQATIAPTPVGGAQYPADASQCFPGWTFTVVGNAVGYNDISIGGPGINLIGPNFPNLAGYTPLQGSYSALMEYFGSGGPPPTLSQTGLVPGNAQSISFLVSGTTPNYVAVTMNGVSIPLVSVSGGRFAGNIAAFAGQSAQLTFSLPSGGGPRLFFDDIQFSNDPVPEPGTLSLVGVGMAVLMLRRTFRRT
jgi:hypothetical protein